MCVMEEKMETFQLRVLRRVFYFERILFNGSEVQYSKQREMLLYGSTSGIKSSKLWDI